MRTIGLRAIALVGLCACSAASSGGRNGSGTGDDAGAAPADNAAVSLGSGSSGVSSSGGGSGSGGALGSGGGAAGGGLSLGSSGGALGLPAMGGTSPPVLPPASSSSGGLFDAGPAPAAGILTAGVWDDSLNYSFFTPYLAGKTTLSGNPGFTTADYDAAYAEYQQRTAHTVIDAALVIDTTGSMADELSYLTAEFAAISGAVSAAFPSADQRWALVVYRDTPDSDPGDAYIVKHYDFTSDMQAFAGTVGAQTASGGGDFPESPELGLEELQQLSWRSGSSVAKVAFWVGDAPQHTYRAAAMKKAISDVHQAGVHVYPVSASGTDDLLELTMRTTAQITGGRYLFLTNDSGVGNDHKIPEIPCYYVTRLERALVRVASMELSGNYLGPDPADVIRTSGNPATDGTCTLPDDAGTVVHIF